MLGGYEIGFVICVATTLIEPACIKTPCEKTLYEIGYVNSDNVSQKVIVQNVKEQCPKSAEFHLKLIAPSDPAWSKIGTPFTIINADCRLLLVPRFVNNHSLIQNRKTCSEDSFFLFVGGAELNSTCSMFLYVINDTLFTVITGDTKKIDVPQLNVIVGENRRTLIWCFEASSRFVEAESLWTPKCRYYKFEAGGSTSTYAVTDKSSTINWMMDNATLEFAELQKKSKTKTKKRRCKSTYQNQNTNIQ